jgi:hypothetical protein
MSQQGGEAPKIIIDSDWKHQAQAEREKLAEAEAKAHAEAASKDAAGRQGPDGLPPADFRTLIEMLAMQAIMYMGGVADKRTGQAVFDPEYSRHMIDLLSVLEAKTKGNLNAEETADLTGLLHSLRVRWVELSQMMAEQIASGRGGAGGPPPVSGPGGMGMLQT